LGLDCGHQRAVGDRGIGSDHHCRVVRQMPICREKVSATY
jgi:hypothetical protein